MVPAAVHETRTSVKRVAGLVLILAGLGAAFYWWSLKPAERAVGQVRSVAPPAILDKHCKEAVGPPRVEQITEGVWVAIGWDLANTILVQTEDGNVVIDAGMSPERAQPVREALLAKAPGPIRALVFTHSHIDHVGGASVWVEEGTEIWATEVFTEHFMKQYGAFRELETRRAARQFGAFMDDASLPCSALGRRIDLVAATRTGARMPNKRFSGEASFEVGGQRFELIEAHGETHDQLFVWLPDKRVLMPGDNYYAAFPNLYTIRGTSPRPVDAWIDSLDRMRRKDAEHLVPSHTTPISGRAAVRSALRDYRDGIQWVRDRVVQGANAGLDPQALAESVGLPKHLAGLKALEPLYGQIDWSARAIYGNHLGWFDGRPEALYPMPRKAQATATVEAMGGAPEVWKRVEAAEPRWALHLLSLLKDAGGETAPGGRWALTKAKALETLAEEVGNTNGRGYLVESARELRHGPTPLPKPKPVPELIDEVPLRIIFGVMASRLIPERSIDTHEAVRFEFSDHEPLTVTVRRGVAEIVYGPPLPDAIAPIATVKTDASTWGKVALQLERPVQALSDGRLEIEGDRAGFLTFTKRFRRGL